MPPQESLPTISTDCFDGTGCRVAVYDKAPRGSVRRFDQIEDMSEHVRRITGFLKDPRLDGFAPGCELLSVSIRDCLESGYDAVKERLVAEHGPIHIEAHAYSGPASAAMADYEAQIARSARHPSTQSLILCSPGHDANRVRSPATSGATVTVGLWRHDQRIVGAGLGELIKPALLVADQTYPALNPDDSITPIGGTSPAVTFVAGLAALLHERLRHTRCPLQLHAALLLLASPCSGTFLLDNIAVLRQPIGGYTLTPGKARQRHLTLRINRTDAASCRLSVVATPSTAESIARGHRFRVTIRATVDEKAHPIDDDRVLLTLDELDPQVSHQVTLSIDGLTDASAITWTGAHVDVLADEIVPVKSAGDTVVVGISASHDASAVLALNGELIAGIQLERLTRIKHDGTSSLAHEQAIRYCLDVTGLTADDVDVFAFNVQALAPGYVGLTQPLARSTFTLFDPLGPKALFISHHLCHAYAGYSGSRLEQATVAVADGSGGVSIGHDDLVLDGEQLATYLRRGRGNDPMQLHVFSVYAFNRHGYRLQHREYAPSFNVRSGSESLGETYASVSQLVFGSWQASGKLMGLAPYGVATRSHTLLHRTPDGELNFSFAWKLSTQFPQPSSNVLHYADLAARIQSDLETALLDRFHRHVGLGASLVFSGGIALNSVANYRIRSELQPRDFSLLPAQHDAGIAIGAAAAALHRLTGVVPNHLFRHDFLGYRYSERDVALAINAFSDRLQVRRVSPAAIAQRIADGAVFGFFSLHKGSEFGPRALGARSILADPRKRSTWNSVNKWIKYREEFRPFAPVVTAEALSTFFDAHGTFPYMLEIVKVREAFRSTLAGITHVDGSARVQTVTADDAPEIHALLTAFEAVADVPILLNTSFNVRGQPMVEQPGHALEMLLSTQLSGVVFGDLLVEIPESTDNFALDDKLTFSPGTRMEITANQDGSSSVLRVCNQGKTIRLRAPVYQVLQAIASGCNVGEALKYAGTQHSTTCLDMLRRFVRLRMLNWQRPTNDHPAS
ncbi:hypothetical protein FPJ27_14670 [Burkholderia sp. MS455]|uniref:carbamoyltransferase C-terminal domain-containing protein n=1 Tax=Burkholderia sp. MS455 TaxID=2811788 RepID=UPI00195EB2BF|nr:carbamoyltransferase C-terminal domain-containing protein [Burkholderia sp. MS455]QRR07546.1 hypothetical protein FPJ27_14670 [Burkholderia sp. MS455]